ncbi:MAG TPA: 30S ribosomal protein S16, partial [Rubricoccaceae bacterium]
MSVKIRMRRMGRKQHPVYALVATDSRSARDGKFIEDLGRYEPVAEPARFSVNAERVIYWLGQGAQMSDTARNLLQKEGVLMQSAMSRGGKTADEIATALGEFQERRAARTPSKLTNAERRANALKAEREQAAAKAKELRAEREAREAELERQRQESEDAARAEAQQKALEAAAAETAANPGEAALAATADAQLNSDLA